MNNNKCPRMLILAVCGAMRSGKDVVAQHLLQAYGFHIRKFAEPLKAGLQDMFGFSYEQVEGGLKDEVDARWGVTPRAVMQFMGTEVFQYQLQQLMGPGLGRTFWVRRFLHALTPPSEEDGKSNIVVSDLRFRHEAEALASAASLGWKTVIVRVDRPNLPAPAAALAHASEQEHRAIVPDAVLVNDADIPALLRQVDALMVRLNIAANNPAQQQATTTKTQ